MSVDFFTKLLRSGKALGLSLGASSVRTVSLAQGATGVFIAGCAEVAVTPGDGEEPLQAALTALAASLGDKSRLSAGTPARLSRVRFFGLPFAQAARVREVLAYEVESLFMGGVENMVLDFLPLDEKTQAGDLALVFGAPEEVVGLTLERLRQAGLDPDLLNPEPLGLVMAGARLFTPPEDTDGQEGPFRILLDLGASQTTLALFKGTRPLKVRTLSYGGWDVTQALARALELGFEEAEALKRATDLARDYTAEPDDPAAAMAVRAQQTMRRALGPIVLEIERTLASGLAGFADARVSLACAGGGALTNGLVLFLKKATGLEAGIVGLDDQLSQGLSGLKPEFTIPAGLALLGLAGRHQPNLRQGAFARAQALVRHRTPLALLGTGLLVFGLLALGSLVMDYFYQRNRYESAKAEINQIFTQTLPEVTRIVSPLAQMRAKVEELGLEAGAQGRGRVLDVLLAISEATKARTSLRVLDLSITPATVELQGEGGSFQDHEKLRDELAGLPLFEEVTLGGARKDSATGKVTFKLTIKRMTK